MQRNIIGKALIRGFLVLVVISSLTGTGFLILALAFSSNGAGERKNDRQAIQGTWELVTAVYDGKQFKSDGPKTQWAISKSHFSYRSGGQDEYRLHPDKTPKWIDVVIRAGQKKPRKLHGIYALKGDSLKICIGPAGEKRPAKFESKKGSGRNLLILNRISRKVKKWPEPEKTFGKRVKAEFVRAPDANPRATVSKTIDGKTRKRVLTIYGKDIGFTYTLAFSPDGKILASGHGRKSLWLWDAKTGKCLASLRGHAHDISSVTFSPDGKILASASYDMTVDLWDLSAKKHMSTIYPQDGSLNAVAFSPDGKTLAIAGGLMIKLWEVSSRKIVSVIETQKPSIRTIAFSPDGKTLVSAGDDKVIRLWDVKTGRQIAVLRGHTNTVSSVSFSRDGTLLASASEDKTIKLWDFKSRKNLATLKGHADKVTSVSFNPDGTMLASGSWDNSVKLWSVNTGKNIRTLVINKGVIMSVVFSPDGRYLAAGGGDYQIKIWELRPKK